MSEPTFTRRQLRCVSMALARVFWKEQVARMELVKRNPYPPGSTAHAAYIQRMQQIEENLVRQSVASDFENWQAEAIDVIAGFAPRNT